MSGYEREMLAERGLETTESPPLLKPFDAGELLRRVRETLEQPKGGAAPN